MKTFHSIICLACVGAASLGTAYAGGNQVVRGIPNGFPAVPAAPKLIEVGIPAANVPFSTAPMPVPGAPAAVNVPAHIGRSEIVPPALPAPGPSVPAQPGVASNDASLADPETRVGLQGTGVPAEVLDGAKYQQARLLPTCK